MRMNGRVGAATRIPEESEKMELASKILSPKAVSDGNAIDTCHGVAIQALTQTIIFAGKV